MNFPIQCTVKSSRHFACLLSLCYSGGALCLFTSQAPWELKWIAWVAATFLFLRYLGQSPWAITEIRFDEPGGAWLRTHRGEVFNAHLLGDSFLSGYWVVLNFRRAKKSCIVPELSVVLFPDSIDMQTFRRLKTYLFSKKIA